MYKDRRAEEGESASSVLLPILIEESLQRVLLVGVTPPESVIQSLAVHAIRRRGFLPPTSGLSIVMPTAEPFLIDLMQAHVFAEIAIEVEANEVAGVADAEPADELPTLVAAFEMEAEGLAADPARFVGIVVEVVAPARARIVAGAAAIGVRARSHAGPMPRLDEAVAEQIEPPATGNEIGKFEIAGDLNVMDLGFVSGEACQQAERPHRGSTDFDDPDHRRPAGVIDPQSVLAGHLQFRLLRVAQRPTLPAVHAVEIGEDAERFDAVGYL
jgi:hypothetical protein